MKEELKQKLVLADKNKAEIVKVANKLKKQPRIKYGAKNLDDVTHQAHELAFQKIDCLDCANCCKTTSPTFYERDIDRIAKHLKIKPSAVIANYLHKDEVGDYVLNVAPCPFLDYENYCTIYESRPTACREYPHTDRKRFYQILDISVKNTEICPAVAEVFEQLKKVYS